MASEVPVRVVVGVKGLPSEPNRPVAKPAITVNYTANDAFLHPICGQMGSLGLATLRLVPKTDQTLFLIEGNVRVPTGVKIKVPNDTIGFIFGLEPTAYDLDVLISNSVLPPGFFGEIVLVGRCILGGIDSLTKIKEGAQLATVVFLPYVHDIELREDAEAVIREGAAEELEHLSATAAPTAAMVGHDDLQISNNPRRECMKEHGGLAYVLY